ncbi:RacP protein OS=Streptomyces fumanus OX=67302 GN=GCM10018772_61450 PE=4 SV=1 [Streptomyces fumanus]
MPRRREARPLDEQYGDLVRVALMEARPAGLNTRQLITATSLTKSQVTRGIRHLRDVGAAEHHLTPIIWRRRDGYLFSDEPADWIEYEKKQFRLILGRLTRMITGTLDPHLARYPDDEWAQLASAQLTGVRATLAQLTK